MVEQKSTYVVMGQNEDEDQKMYFETSADMVVTQKADGSVGNVQESLEALRGLLKLSGTTLTINMDVLGGI